MIFRARQLFFGHCRFFQVAEFADDQIQHLAHGFFCGPGINSQHSGIRIRRDFAEYRVSQAALFANVLEQAGRHAAAQQIIEYRDAEAIFVP